MSSPQPLDALARILHELLSGEAVPASRLSTSLTRALLPLTDIGAVRMETRGRGKALTCLKPDLVKVFADNRYPSGLYLTSTALGSRTAALAQFRDSKADGGLDFELVHIRVFDDAALTLDGLPVDACRQTQILGCVSVVLGMIPTPRLAGRIALAEGPEVFMRFDWRSLGVGVVVYYRGRASERLLRWAGDAEVADILHCGDYDPVGLDEYLRARARLGDRVIPYVPDNLEALFDRFSKPELLQDQAGLVRRLQQSQDPYVQRMLRLIQGIGGGMENEALLVDNRVGCMPSWS
ncbi:hypothetical protein [Cupriavidus sp. DF5525]|uniref:hypothetical protein n=1 Tax=Cupriavidus sp. DF5525 TaxID=3160989 RepID=UPI0032E03E0A